MFRKDRESMKKCKKCNGQGYVVVNDGERLGNRRIQLVGSSGNTIWGGKVKVNCTNCYGKGHR